MMNYYMATGEKQLLCARGFLTWRTQQARLGGEKGPAHTRGRTVDTH